MDLTILKDYAMGGLNLFVMLFLIAAVGAFVVGCFWLYTKWKRYSQYNCRIWEQDGFGQWRELYDDAGVFVDRKTQNKRLFLKKNNVGLSPDNIPYIPSGSKKIIYLLKTGLKNFRFIKIRPNNPSVVLSVGEEDVNWAINSYERQKKIFSQDRLMAYMPFILLAFVSLVILVIFIYFFKEFGTLKGVAQSLSEAAHSLAEAKAGTVVINP